MQLVSEGSGLCLPFAFLSASRQPGPRRGLGLWFRRDGSLPKVSFDAPRFQDIAFAPQILVRWLSGRKRRFAKALYLKRVPRVRIPPSPVHFSSFQLEARSLGESAAIDWKRSLAKYDEGKRIKELDFLTRSD